MQDLNELKDKIETLETERSQLKNEIDSLRKAAETRVSALEADIHQMHEQIQILRELLVTSEDTFSTSVAGSPSAVGERLAANPNPVPAVDSDSVKKTVLIVENDLKEIGKTSEESNVKPEAEFKDIYGSLLKTLDGDERKVVEILVAHEGKYPQKYIRTEAELSWLQTNRVVSRLADRGIVTLEKDGSLGRVVLSPPK